MPTVSYFLSTTGHPIDDDHPLWRLPLPRNRLHGTIPSEAVDVEAITYGRYFSAITCFCMAAGWRRVLTAVSRKLARPVIEEELRRLSVFCEKHGAFYHPARLQVALADQTLSFVVNVAASNHGRQALSREVTALEQLSDQRPFGWFPRVYSSTSVDLPMFLGDWFEDFHEFHLTRRPGSGELALVVWNGTADRCLLSVKQAADLYRNVAMILAACYDPITSRQIFPWHHAAGDFVVRVDGDRAAVRLITVRSYAPITGSARAPDNERSILDALVVFFIHLSIRMRLDRLDGVNNLVWAPDRCLVPMMDGFFQGLDLTARITGFSERFPEAFRQFFNHHDAATLLAMARAITATVFNARSEERALIDSCLDRHIHDLCRLLAVE